MIRDGAEFTYGQRVRIIEPGLSMTGKIGRVANVSFRSHETDDDLRKRYLVTTGSLYEQDQRYFFADDLEAA